MGVDCTISELESQYNKLYRPDFFSASFAQVRFTTPKQNKIII